MATSPLRAVEDSDGVTAKNGISFKPTWSFPSGLGSSDDEPTASPSLDESECVVKDEIAYSIPQSSKRRRLNTLTPSPSNTSTTASEPKTQHLQGLESLTTDDISTGKILCNSVPLVDTYKRATSPALALETEANMSDETPNDTLRLVMSEPRPRGTTMVWAPGMTMVFPYSEDIDKDLFKPKADVAVDTADGALTTRISHKRTQIETIHGTQPEKADNLFVTAQAEPTQTGSPVLPARSPRIWPEHDCRIDRNSPYAHPRDPTVTEDLLEAEEVTPEQRLRAQLRREKRHKERRKWMRKCKANARKIRSSFPQHGSQVAGRSAEGGKAQPGAADSDGSSGTLNGDTDDSD